MVENIPRLYEDHFDLTEKERRILLRGTEVKEDGRHIVGIRNDDKFIVKIGSWNWWYVITTKEAIEVFPGQSYIGAFVMECYGDGGNGFTIHHIYIHGDAIWIKDDDDNPFGVVDEDGAWIDYPSILSEADIYSCLGKSQAFKYWYNAYGVNCYNHLKDGNLSDEQIIEICKDDQRLDRWLKATKGRKGKKTIPTTESYLKLIKSKFKEIRYDEETGCLCF